MDPVAEFESAGWFLPDEATVTVTCSAGDVLVASSVCGNQLRDLTIDDTAAGGLTWATKGTVSKSSRCSIAQWTATVGPGQGGTFDVTASFPSAGAGGLSVQVWPDVEVGAHAVGDATDPAAPSLDIETTADDSAIVVVVGDHETVDGTTRTWRTGAGTLTEDTYFRSNSENAVYLGHHGDAGAAGVKAVGLTAPATMRPSIAAVELTPATAAEDVTGTATGSGGGTGAATGTREVSGVATGSGTGSGTATGTREVVGAATGAAGGAGAATGVVEVTGVATGTAGGVGAAAGVREVVGHATGSGGGVGHMTGPTSDHDVQLTASLGEQDSPTASLGARRWTATLGSQP